ncbi:hypothetical protein MNBD_ALPHA09-686 [hydrothermal vent metagenome]|uniref:Flagellar hook-basal body complex protein FliE n=1 Tax=hydrothermal vent metagenome TaxID=652676 RepID=A0A3B0TRU2_9ZZZZ
MSVSAVAAANAYAVQAKEIADAAKAASGPPAAEGGFASLLENTMNSLSETGKAADQQMQLQASGQANVIDVVTSVAEAELTVQTIVAVRDRVLSAYQEILRMPI